MIIVEKRMLNVTPMLESYLEKDARSLLLLHACVSGKVGVAGRFDPLSRDLPVP